MTERKITGDSPPGEVWQDGPTTDEWMAMLRYKDKVTQEMVGVVQAVVEAARTALAHVEELEDAWRRGVLSEPPYDGGTRSNRNMDVKIALKKALDALDKGGRNA